MGMGKLNAGGYPVMGLHPIHGGVEILLVALCYGNQDNLQPDGPVGLHTDLTLPYLYDVSLHADFVTYRIVFF